MPSSVYFIQTIDKGPIKIGHTLDPLTRLSTLMAWSPVRLQILTTAPGGAICEGELHWRFRAHRLHGEWFQPNPQLMELIETVKRTGVLDSKFIGAAFPERHWTYSSRLGDVLSEAGLPRRELASELGISLGRVHYFCNEYVSPHQVAAILLILEARGHRVTIADLVGPPKPFPRPSLIRRKAA